LRTKYDPEKLPTTETVIAKVSKCGFECYFSDTVIFFVSGIHSKNLVAILHLLVTLARYYRAPVRLPENVIMNVIVVQVTPARCYLLYCTPTGDEVM